MDRIEAAKIYDDMPVEGRDMPKAEFIRQTLALTNPVRFQQDLDRVMQVKNARRMSALNEKRKIDNAIKNQNT